jgi:hypothetical protein
MTLNERKGEFYTGAYVEERCRERKAKLNLKKISADLRKRKTDN